MTMLDDVGQKIKGKGQKIKGKMRSDPIKGTVDQIKGSLNETAADIKLNARKNADYEDEEDEGLL